MAANRRSALCATPFFTFLVQKIFQAKFLDTVEVSDHAHMVFCTIALVQCFQSLAGEVFTFKTKPDASVCQQFARIVHMRAVFSSRNASRAIFFVKSPFVEIIFLELISDA